MDKTEHAMNSLIASVIWDEARFGLPLDLERFMIVATSDFNMGAMENKGLNIFNTKYVLANSATATDTDFANIESVVGHEYFHNWTGNRVTCRDWFQLSLKEGLTVFRDQEFSMDLCAEPSARAVKRIEDVRVLRTAQFPEDAGPMAHPVRPDSYVEINNFYTVTIYEKGAEVVRMMQTLVGRAGFAAGMKLYFAAPRRQRRDLRRLRAGHRRRQPRQRARPPAAAVQALVQPGRHARRAGAAACTTQPRAATRSRSRRAARPRRARAVKEPFVIPVALGLLDANGTELPLQLAHWNQPERRQPHLRADRSQRELHLRQRRQSSRCPPSCAVSRRRWCWTATTATTQLLNLLAHDTDAFNRWEAGQRLALRRALQAIRADGPVPHPLDAAYLNAMRDVLRHPTLDAAFKELVLTLPSETYIAEQLDVVDPQRIHAVRETMREQLAEALHDDWAWAYEQHKDNGAYRPDPVSTGRRALAGLALAMLCLAARDNGDPVWPGKAYQRFKDAGNMTDRFNALSALVSQRPAAGAGRARPLPHPVQERSPGDRQVVRPAGRCARPRWQRVARGAPAHGPPGLQPQEPQPRPQRDLQLLQRQPRRLPPRRRGGLCVLERARDRARRHQPAGGRPPRARAGPLEETRRALPQRRARSHRPRGRQDRPEQRRARSVTRALAD